MISQATEKLAYTNDSYQGVTLTDCGKSHLRAVLYQGTTSVVPLSLLFMTFRADFSRRGQREYYLFSNLYNRSMARGWESKSVEAQMEESSISTSPGKKPITAEERLRQQKKVELTLSRSRVAQQLEASTNDRYSKMLRLSLAELDRQLAELGD